jgi:hypothetical protein
MIAARDRFSTNPIPLPGGSQLVTLEEAEAGME